MATTINDIQDRVRATGSHWFDPDTMRMFGTRVVGGVFDGKGGVYFATSDKQFDGSRAFSVRQFHPETAEIGTVGELGEHDSRAKAIAAARKLAGDAAAETDEKLMPITDADQLLHDLHAHGCPLATSQTVRSLMAGARKHHRACEMQCNGETGADRLRAQAELAIARTCRKIGCGATFQGDPRGCTAKLVMPDGHTDDFTHEGLCIPQ